MNRAKLLASIILLFILIFTANTVSASPAELEKSLIIRLDGVITPASAEHVAEALEGAELRNEIVIILIDTPGGSMDATIRIVDLIERSRVPIVGFVYPPGGRAWSAGTYILMATHVAAMAPNTIIGSAQPVVFDPVGGGSTPIMDNKTLNALAKFMSERARAHGRDQRTAELFVTENLNLNDEEALGAHVIELRAESLDALLRVIDGRTIQVGGAPVIIRTAGMPVREVGPSLRVRFLDIVSDPILAYLIFIFGFFTLIFGIQTPGAGAEILGGFMLILGLIGLGYFGINLGAVLLAFIGFGLLVGEFLTPGFGVLGISGFASLLLGSLLLFPSEWAVSAEWLNTLYIVLIVVPLALGGLIVFAAYKVVQARRMKPYPFEIMGDEGVAVGEITAEAGGFVRQGGELWKAKTSVSISDRQPVKIIGREGPALLVEPIIERTKG